MSVVCLGEAEEGITVPWGQDKPDQPFLGCSDPGATALMGSKQGLSCCNLRSPLRAGGASASHCPHETSPSTPHGVGLTLLLPVSPRSAPGIRRRRKYLVLEVAVHSPLPSKVPLGGGGRRPAPAAGICGAEGERLLKHH